MSNKRASDYLTQKELAQIMALPARETETGKRDFAMMSLLYFTGARSAELAAMKRGDFTIRKKSLEIKILGKGKKTRSIYVKDVIALKAITAYWKFLDYDPKENEPVFLTIRKQGALGDNGIDSRAVWLCVVRYAKVLGLKKVVTPHSFRHSCLTHLLKSGQDIDTVKTFAGHSKIETTARYLHTEEEQLEQAAEALVRASR